MDDMAQRRMFSKKITDTDQFLDMPMSAQALYFHLNMEADDDGFLGNAKTVRRKVGASEDDMKLLMAKQFIIPFEDSGVVVIKDWKIHNYIRKDTYNETMYSAEKALLEQASNGSYTFRRRLVDEPSPQVRLGKDRLDKDSKEIKDVTPPTAKPKPVRHKYGEYKNVLLTDQDMEKLQTEFPSDWQDRIERLSSYIASTGKTYKNHLATIRNWARKDKAQPKPQQAYGQPVKREEMPNWDAQTTASSPSRKAEIEKMMEELFIDNEEENR